LHDTALGRVVDAVPDDQPTVSMYVCGPTVYDVPHLGHGRFSLVFDVLRRYLEWKGHDVRYVSNITDVDDNILNRAAREGRSAQSVVDEYEAVWWSAMDALGVKRPTADPHATAFVDRMVALIDELFSAGFAYTTSDGVYMDVSRVDGYGLLARQSLDSLRSGARVEANEEKRSPIDFALWKFSKAGEDLSWPSPWGDGRPGWHTECVVMSLDLLGEGFDIHGGGQDLAFPHHENERAQAVALGRAFARHWVHNGFVEVGGEKMSKSLGNFTTLTDMLARTDARAYRLLVLRSHYRSPVEVTVATTDDASAALARLDEFARNHPPSAGAVEPDPEALAQFRALMDDDLQTPQVVALLFDLVRRANTGDGGAAAAAREICRAVGLELLPGGGSEDVAADAVALARQRDEARARKDFATSDALRDRLQSMGYVVQDTPDGTRIRPAR
jgi:cysteinyl-tRNA synthetase